MRLRAAGRASPPREAATTSRRAGDHPVRAGNEAALGASKKWRSAITATSPRWQRWPARTVTSSRSNLGADHLEVYGSMGRHRAAKCELVENLGPDGGRRSAPTTRGHAAQAPKCAPGAVTFGGSAGTRAFEVFRRPEGTLSSVPAAALLHARRLSARRPATTRNGAAARPAAWASAWRRWPPGPR